MRTLIPPPVVAALLAACMWVVDRTMTATKIQSALLVPVALVLLGLALWLLFAAALAFFHHKTTINPLAPARASNLITSGVYRLSRNPIYLGDLLLLAAFAVWLGNLVNVLFLAAFVWIMNRGQIAAEEEALRANFGERYAAYTKQVRRWL